ncbi:hypothetical protein BG005_005588 [Podila minutissima]|nr:hypothetical protein BG005_005588 [Podila minutissima]
MEFLASIKELWTRLTCGARPCVFCEIASGVRKEEILYQDDEILAFYDIKPAAETHIMVIPARHIVSVHTVTVDDYDLLLRMKAKALDLLKQFGHDVEASRLGFHIPPFNTVNHLHLHVLGGKFKSALRESKYEPGKIYYMELSQLLTKLETKMPTEKR